MYPTSLELKQKWIALKDKNPLLRIRDAAKILKVSEVELLATGCEGNVTRLEHDKIRDILKELPKLGPVMSLTRNEYVVHELKGTYEKPHITEGKVGFFSGYIDLRILFDAWASAFAVRDTINGDALYSLQFFAKDGEAIHKIYLNNQSDHKLYEHLLKEYSAQNQSCSQEVLQKKPITIKNLDKEDKEIEEFGKEWLAMKDVHDFNPLCRKYGLTKWQALHMAPKNMAYKLPPKVAREVITLAQKREIPIMIFVGNQGMVQIYSGLIKRCCDQKGWFNVLDERFNLHLYEAGIHEVWLSYRPTRGNLLSTIECYDAHGQVVMQFFGSGKSDTDELPQWKALTSELIS